MNLYWPIFLIVGANVFYHICAKSMPDAIDPLASLVVTYTVSAVISLILYFALNRDGSLIQEYSHLNWTSFVFGIALVGLEVGCIYMYKVGWSVNTGYIVQSAILAIALLIVGFVAYHEAIIWNKAVGVAICMVGLYFINK